MEELLERLKQGKGKKEICYGICVTSYLSKIERGLVNPDSLPLVVLCFNCLDDKINCATE